MALGAGHVDPGLKTLGVGDEAEGDLGGQAFDSGAGGDGVQAQTADDQGHHGFAVRAEGPSIGLGRHAAVRRDARQGTVGAGREQARNRGLGQGIRGRPHRGGDGRTARHAGAVRQGDQRLAASGAIGVQQGRIAQILIEVQPAHGEGVGAGRRGLGHGRALQGHAGGGRARARVAQDRHEQNPGGQNEGSRSAHGDRRLLQRRQDGVEAQARAVLRRQAGGGGESGLALGEHGQGGARTTVTGRGTARHGSPRLHLSPAPVKKP
ncbi:hypothetical protein D3C80_1123620 [compost metagenome]